MLRKVFLICLPLVILISACQASTATPVVNEAYASQPAVSPTSQTAPAGQTDPLDSEESTQQPEATASAAPSPFPAEMTCTLVSAQPTPGPTQTSLFPPVSAGEWTHGPEDAYVTIVEYSDFECPSCAQLAPILKQLVEEKNGNLRVVYRHFPLLSIHPKAAAAVQAAEAAGRQEKFWDMHDVLFARQAEWVELPEEEFIPWLEAAAGDLGLDVEQFRADFNSPEIASLAQNAWEQGVSTGIPHTPFLLFNGEIYDGPVSQSLLSAVIDLTALEERQFTACPEMVIESGKEYFATIKTEKGDILLRLLPDVAPMAVNNFVFLAQAGWYQDITFHRVLPGFVAQAGDPTGTGVGGPGYAFANETSPAWTFDRAGLVAMANSGVDTNGSQFFITMGPAAHLNGDFTIFGEVLEGMQVVTSLTERNPVFGRYSPPGDRILDIVIEEK